MGVNWKGALGAAGGSIASLGDTMVKQHFLELRDQRMAEIANQKMDKQQTFQSSERVAGQGYLSKESGLKRDNTNTQNELQMNNDNEQGQLNRDASSQSAQAGYAHDEKMTGIKAKNDQESMMIGAGINKALQDDDQAHDSAKTVYLEQQKTQQAQLKAVAGGKGGGDINKLMTDIGKTSHSMAGDLISDQLPSLDKGSYNTARSELSNAISQKVQEGIASTGVIDYATASNAAVQEMSQNEKYSELFQKPVGDDGSGMFSNDSDQSAMFVNDNTPADADKGYLSSFMKNQNWGQGRQQKVLDILRPKQAQQGAAPESATQYLMQNPSPEVKTQFQSKYGYLPEGIE